MGDIEAVTPPGVPFPVRLFRFEKLGPRIHQFQIVKVITGDHEAARRDRIQAACEKKFPKLARWKLLSGARTILLLEDNDIQLTNQSLVADAFLPIARARDDAPDETYVIMTYGDTTWYAWPILIDNVSYFELAARYHPIHLEFDSTTLRPVTAR